MLAVSDEPEAVATNGEAVRQVQTIIYHESINQSMALSASCAGHTIGHSPMQHYTMR